MSTITANAKCALLAFTVRVVTIACCSLGPGTTFPGTTAVAGESAADAIRATNPFYAFDNGVGRGKLSPTEQAAILADLGYDGIGYTGTENIPQMLAALEPRGLKMFNTYVKLDVRPDQVPYDPTLPEAIQQLRGHGTLIWLHVHGDQPSGQRLDDRAVRRIREIAAMAAESDLRVALYPHTGFYVATVQDAVRLVKKVDRKNVGASFNLCHYLKLDDEANLEQRIHDAIPYLFAVSINGADRGDTKKMGWDRLIQTLDRGDFDVHRLLRLLIDSGYRGPIGLQCYAIPGDVRDNLARSMKAWKRFTK